MISLVYRILKNGKREMVWMGKGERDTFKENDIERERKRVIKS